MTDYLTEHLDEIWHGLLSTVRLQFSNLLFRSDHFSIQLPFEVTAGAAEVISSVYCTYTHMYIQTKTTNDATLFK